MEDKASYIHGNFASIADRYDLHNTLLSYNRDKYWRKFTVSKAGITGGERVLDVATGTGKLALELAKKVGESGEVIGIDFCQKMLDKAKKKETTEYLLATSENLPFPDNTFDCATIGFALRNVTDMEETLEEMTRVIKPGGKAVCLEFSHPRNRLFKKIYRLYIFAILPLIGGLISGHRDVYSYLPRSIEEFLEPEELKQIMEGVGLKDVQFYPLTWGIVAVHLGTKS